MAMMSSSECPQHSIKEDQESRPSQKRLQKCASAILEDFRTLAFDEEPTDGVYSWQSSSMGLRRAILRQLGTLSGEKRTSLEEDSSKNEDVPERAAKKSKSCHIISTMNSSNVTPSPPPMASVLDRFSRNASFQTSKLLDEVEQEMARRICEVEERPTIKSHTHRSWNPSEGGRIAQAFRAYGVPDSTEFTKSALSSLSEHDSSVFMAPAPAGDQPEYNYEEEQPTQDNTMTSQFSSHGFSPATVTEEDSKTAESDARYVWSNH